MRTLGKWRRSTHLRRLCRDGEIVVVLLKTQSVGFVSLLISPSDMKLLICAKLTRSSIINNFYFIFVLFVDRDLLSLFLFAYSWLLWVIVCITADFFIFIILCLHSICTNCIWYTLNFLFISILTCTGLELHIYLRHTGYELGVFPDLCKSRI